MRAACAEELGEFVSRELLEENDDTCDAFIVTVTTEGLARELEEWWRDCELVPRMDEVVDCCPGSRPVDWL